MRSFGIFLIVMGVGSALLPYLGMQFILVAWIGTWGPTVAWLIRGAMVIVGLGLMGLATRSNSPPEPPVPTPRP